jgi:nucleotide-binding universal stress UspA family protein
MKILFAADGSESTKKATAFLVRHTALVSGDSELLVLNVQPSLPARVAPMVGSGVVDDYYRDEADRVLDPIRSFLAQHPVRHRCEWVVGNASAEIVAASRREGVDMIVMGTRGHGLIGRALLGSVAQRVVNESDMPVLLIQ